MGEYTQRQQVLTRWSALKSERASWMLHWSEISNYLTPRSGRFFTQDRNRGQRRHNNIYDNTAGRALKVLAAGMMSGMTSPARPWFRLGLADKDLEQYHAVKLWLNQATMLMHKVFQRSNTYRSLHSMYVELGAFGTGAAIIVPNDTTIIHHYPLTIGEYAIATDFEGNVTTLYREFDKSVQELVKEFGRENCSRHVVNLYDRGTLDAWVTVCHVIEPRADRDESKVDKLNMPWRSCYFELGSNADNKVLRESGFKRFPAVAPRWEVSGGDIYGNGPGMEALGDIKQLQHEQLRKAQGIDFQTNPPLQVPTSLMSRPIERLPGGITYVDQNGPSSGIKSAFEVNLDLNHLLADIQDVRERIRQSFYADLFLMLSQQDSRMTATEVAERHEEKLLMLGPVLERLQNELLDPLIETTFDAITQAQLLPPAPQELQGQIVDVELISMLAQAQRAIGTNSMDRFLGSVGAVAQFRPEVVDKIDTDKWVEVYADSLGVTPDVLADDKVVEATRAQRAQQQAQAAQMAAANAQADTAQKLGGIDTSKPSALTDITNQFSGYT